MKILIINALNEANERVERITPQTKRKTKFIKIDVIPHELNEFLVKNNIPKDAWFGIDDDDDICVCYDVDVPTTDKDKLDFKRRTFENSIFKKIYDIFIANNYQRVGVPTHLFKPYRNWCKYDMYINKEYDKLIEYYSMYFKLKS
jgi:hypothetical protein